MLNLVNRLLTMRKNLHIAEWGLKFAVSLELLVDKIKDYDKLMR